MGNCGFSTSDSNKAIYLDDNTSNVVASGNQAYGTSQYCLQIHGGSHNTITNNVCDITSMEKLGFYQDSSYQTHNAAGNVISHMIVYSAGASPSTMWDFIWTNTGTAFNLPSLLDNQYYLVGGPGFSSYASQTSNGTSFTDASPNVGNPLFVAPGSNNYALQGGSPALSPPVSFVPLLTGQGPGI